MKYAYLVKYEWGPKMVKFSYEGRTAKSYIGCKVVAGLIGSCCWVNKRQDGSQVKDSFGEAQALLSMLTFKELDKKKKEMAKINQEIVCVTALVEE